MRRVSFSIWYIALKILVGRGTCPFDACSLNASSSKPSPRFQLSEDFRFLTEDFEKLTEVSARLTEDWRKLTERIFGVSEGGQKMAECRCDLSEPLTINHINCPKQEDKWPNQILPTKQSHILLKICILLAKIVELQEA